jgi:hypothetical protein
MSDMMLPFNVKKNAPPRPEENQIRPPVAWEPLYGTLFMMHSPHVEKIPGGGSEMILPFNFKKIAPPRPQKNQMRPL